LSAVGASGRGGICETKVLVLFDVPEEDGEQTRALLVHQDDAEPFVFVERLDERAQEGAIAPVGERRGGQCG